MLREVGLDCRRAFPPWQVSRKKQIGLRAQAEMAARINASESRKSQSRQNYGAGMPSAVVDHPDQQMLSLHYRSRLRRGDSDMATRLYAALLKRPRPAIRARSARMQQVNRKRDHGMRPHQSEVRDLRN